MEIGNGGRLELPSVDKLKYRINSFLSIISDAQTAVPEDERLESVTPGCQPPFKQDWIPTTPSVVGTRHCCFSPAKFIHAMLYKTNTKTKNQLRSSSTEEWFSSTVVMSPYPTLQCCSLSPGPHACYTLLDHWATPTAPVCILFATVAILYYLHVKRTTVSGKKNEFPDRGFLICQLEQWIHWDTVISRFMNHLEIKAPLHTVCCIRTHVLCTQVSSNMR